MKRVTDHRRNPQNFSGLDLDQFVFNLERFRPFEGSIVFPRRLVAMQTMARPNACVGGLSGREVQKRQNQVRGSKPRYAGPKQPTILIVTGLEWNAVSPVTAQFSFTFVRHWGKLVGNAAQELFVPLGWRADANVLSESFASHDGVGNLGLYHQDFFRSQRHQCLDN
jgi:hypothetical protein